MKKLMNRIFALLVCLSFFSNNFGAHSKVSRFDFMVNIEEAKVAQFRECLNRIDFNFQLEGTGDSPLHYAIRKLATERENEEKIIKNVAYGAGSALGIYGLIYGYLLIKDNAKDYIKSFRGDWNTTLQNRPMETLGYPIGGLMGAAAAIFFVTTLVKNTQKVAQYMLARWTTSTSRLMIIELLVKHPSIDLTIRNAKGQNAHDLVKELRAKDTGYIKDLLDTVEKLIDEKEKQIAAPSSETVKRKK